MPPSTSFLRGAASAASAASRPAAFRGAQQHATNPSFIAAQARAAFRPRPRFQQQQNQFRFGNGGSKRWQSTGGSTTAGDAAGGAKPSWFKRMWDSPIGLKTVHFWAPIMKWAVVLAGISDFARPAEKLSLTQNAALTATGLIWTRWCLIIKPKNYLLAAVNFFLGIVGIVQVSRIFVYNQSLKSKGGVAALPAVVEEKAKDVKEAVAEKTA